MSITKKFDLINEQKLNFYQHPHLAWNFPVELNINFTIQVDKMKQS